MKEEWINEMRRKMEDYREDPPPGLWEDICKELGISPEPVRKPATKRLYWAVAAGILVLVGFFAVYQSQKLDTVPKQEQIASSGSQSQQEQPELPNEDVQPHLLAKEEPHKRSAHKGSGPAVRSVSYEDEPHREPSFETAAVEQVPDEPQQIENLEFKENAQAKQSTQQSNHTFQTSLPSKTAEPSANFKHQKNKWSVGVNASGGLLAANNSVRTDRVYYLQYDANEADAINEKFDYDSYPNSYTNTDFVSKHHLPVRFGVSVQYQLNPHLALLSGINYTRLSSELSIPLYSNIHMDQKLHYLGVPVGLSWQFWSTNHIRFYLSGGTMVEKCVRADVDGGYTGKKPWQWSVNASAGAEYTFIPRLGVYLEPSLGYFFDDGTSLEHYYKEHPLAPSIEFGLRLHLNE